MVIEVLKSGKIKYVLDYHYNKKEMDKAEIIETVNLPLLPTVDNITNYFNYFLQKNRRCTNQVFHVAFNPTYKDLEHLSDEDIKPMVAHYMQEMGYANQPYIIIKHTDIERTHYHVVSIRVDIEGNVIKNDFSIYKSHKLQKDIEERFHLERTTDIKKTRKELAEGVEKFISSITNDDAKNIATIKNKAQLMRRVLAYVFDKFKSNNITTLNYILSLFYVKAQIVREETDNEGIIYYFTDENQKQSSYAIKGSNLGTKYAVASVRKKWEETFSEKELKDNIKQIKDVIDNAISSVSSIKDLQDLLRLEGISTIMMKRNNGDIQGITFIDVVNGCVIKGSELGKQYSAKGLLERINNKTNIHSKDYISKEQFTKMMRLLHAKYSELKSRESQFKKESVLIENLTAYWSDLLFILTQNRDFDNLSLAQKESVVDKFISNMSRRFRSTVSKENKYFIDRMNEFLPYIRNIEKDKRANFLDALSLGCDGHYVFEKGNPSNRLALASFTLTSEDIPHSSHNKIKFDKKTMEQAKAFISGKVDNITFDYYDPDSILKRFLPEEGKAKLQRCMIKCEVERIYKETENIKDCIGKLLDVGILIKPVQMKDGALSYVMQDIASTQLSESIQVSKQMQEQLDKIQYNIKTLPSVVKLTTDKWGNVNKTYKWMVEFERIKRQPYQDKKVRFQIKKIAYSDTLLANKLSEMVNKNKSIDELISFIFDYGKLKRVMNHRIMR